MTDRKGLHFFDRHFDRGVDWYKRQFNTGPHDTQYGEATPDYLYDPEARDRMAATLPEAKLIVIRPGSPSSRRMPGGRTP